MLMSAWVRCWAETRDRAFQGKVRPQVRPNQGLKYNSRTPSLGTPMDSHRRRGTRSSGRDFAEGDGARDGLRDGAGAEFALGVAQMGLDRDVGDVEPVGDGFLQ